MARKSFLQRIDGKGNSRSINGGSRRRGTGPTGMQMYNDLNRVLGAIFRMIGGFFGVDVDKYARRGGRKSVSMSSGRKVRKKSKGKGLFATIGKGFN